MSFKDDILMQTNVEKALQKSFNIHKEQSIENHCIENGLEITGFAIVSQDASELQEFAHSKGFKDVKYDFVPNCRWSCVNFNKLKILWSVKCQQTIIKDIYYNILPGTWKNNVFHADMLSSEVEILITPKLPLDAPLCAASGNYILIPFHTYRIVKDISLSMPTLTFNKKQLQCIEPKNLQCISINRQGIYVNRKNRDKIVNVDLLQEYPIIRNYTLCICHNKNIILQEDLVVTK